MMKRAFYATHGSCEIPTCSENPRSRFTEREWRMSQIDNFVWRGMPGWE